MVGVDGFVRVGEEGLDAPRRAETTEPATFGIVRFTRKWSLSIASGYLSRHRPQWIRAAKGVCFYPSVFRARTFMKDASQPRACAAVVLYKPDLRHLARLAAGLDGVPLLAFANGPQEDAAGGILAAAGAEVTGSLTNIGLGAGLNAVVERAKAKGYSHVLLFDQDSEPAPGLVQALLAYVGEGRGARVGVVAPRLVPPQGEGYKPIRYAWRSAPAPSGLRAVDFAPTSGSLLSLEAFCEVGPFRDAFFIAGLDVEWGFRAWSRGWGSYVACDVVMPHRWGEPVTAGEGDVPQILRHAPVRNYYYARNVLVAAALPHVPWRWKIASCSTLAAQIGVLALKGAPGALRPVRAGLLDALAGRGGPAPPGALGM